MIPKPAPTNDIELLEAIAEGDDQALASLYDRYRLILFGLIQRILHDRAEAEDVLQIVFLQVWQKAAEFDDKRGRPFTWLVTLARSRAIDRLRSLGARDRLTSDETAVVPESAGNAVDDAIASEKAKVVRGALAELPEEQRQVLLLAYFDGFTQSEIAERLATPLGTVKTRMRSGMIRLKKLLSGLEE